MRHLLVASALVAASGTGFGQPADRGDVTGLTIGTGTGYVGVALDGRESYLVTLAPTAQTPAVSSTLVIDGVVHTRRADGVYEPSSPAAARPVYATPQPFPQGVLYGTPNGFVAPGSVGCAGGVCPVNSVRRR